MTTTTLQKNPFWILGVSPRDDRRRILDRAQEKLLLSDSDEIEKAKSTLMSPRARLEAEAAWLPGVVPSKALELVEEVARSPGRFSNPQVEISPLAHTNLLAASFEGMTVADHAEYLTEMLRQFALLVDRISIDESARAINADRSFSGFPELSDSGVLAPVLDQRQRYYRGVVKAVLDELESNTLVKVLTEVVERATEGGTAHAPGLIDGLVAIYEVEAQDFLEKEGQNVRFLVERVRGAAGGPKRDLEAVLDQLMKVVANWDRIAQPIQVSFQSRGKNHHPSIEIAHMVRSLAVELNNRHGLTDESQRLVTNLEVLFAELPEFAERIAQDLGALKDLKHADAAARARQEAEVTYRAEIGTLRKTVLEITPDFVRWGDRRFPLRKVTRIRWGGIHHRTMGVSSGATFTVAFGDDRSQAQVTVKRKEVYTAFVARLHRTVGMRLAMEYLGTLRRGGKVQIGQLVLKDSGVLLPRSKFFGAPESEFRGLSQINVKSWNGNFVVSARDDPRTRAELSYLYTDNTHVAETLLRVALESGHTRLSAPLDGGL